MAKEKKWLYIVLVMIAWLSGIENISSQITLSDAQFLHYADAVIDNETCQKENELLKKKQIEVARINDSIKRIDSLEIEDFKLAINKDTTIRNNYKKGRDDCKEDNRKIKKWNKFFKNTIVTLGVVAIIETSIIIFTIKR